MKPEHISILLVASEHVDNVGAVARAVKNMGFSDLRLVRPPRNWRTKGKKMAMSAVDILQKAKTFSSLKKASEDLNLLIGATRRSGGGRAFFHPFSETISKIRQASQTQKVGIVFGCESKGLANRDLQLCDLAVTIPTSSAFPSLNLAQAVMVVLFSLNQASEGIRSRSGKNERKLFLDKKEVELALRHFEKALKALGYRKGGADLLPRILRTTRGLIKRGGLLAEEAQMIKGLSRRICEKVLSCSSGAGTISPKER